MDKEITNKHLRKVDQYEIKCIEDIIKGKESRGERADFEKGLLKSWRKHLKTPPLSPQSKSKRLKQQSAVGD